MKIEKLLEEHLKADEEFQAKINRVIFGDDVNEKGMKDKVDEMHDILVSARNVGGFFSGFGGTLKWLLIIGAVIGLLKGWWGGIIHYLITTVR